MRNPAPSYETLQRLAKADLGRAIELGASAAARARSEALRDAFHQAGLGLAQIFGLVRRPLPVPRRVAR